LDDEARRLDGGPGVAGEVVEFDPADQQGGEISRGGGGEDGLPGPAGGLGDACAPRGFGVGELAMNAEPSGDFFRNLAYLLCFGMVALAVAASTMPRKTR